MNLVRICPITSKHVIYSGKRENKPADLWDKAFKLHKVCDFEYDKNCPFCKGNEPFTPGELYIYPDKENWKIRIVPNKYPIVGGDDSCVQGKYEYHTPGKHYVIIESDKHCDTYFNMTDGEFYRLYEAVHSAYTKLFADEETNYVCFFKNYQMMGGASLYHPHSQIMSLLGFPDVLCREIDGTKKYISQNGSCPYCDMIDKQRRVKDRLIYENENFIAFEPYASRYKFETWIAPKKHISGFEHETDLKGLAQIVSFTFKALFNVIGNFPYNFYLHSLPKKYQGEDFHYHFEIIPRISGGAGFEMCSGICVNTLLPEDAAGMVREALCRK